VATLLTDQTYEMWTNYYRFRDKLRYNSRATDEVNSPEGARDIFHAYVGGVFSQATGPLLVNAWVYRLVVSPQERTKFEGKMPLFLPSQQQSPPQPTYPFPMPPPPPPPLTQQFSSPYLRSRTSSISSVRNMSTDDLLGGASSAALSNGKVAYLPRFNEITTQRKMDVQYPAEQKGLQHAPRWVVKCVGEYRAETDFVSPTILIDVSPVNGTEMGIGAATTKQLAKEEAAKQAFYAMNLSMIN
jgi:dsRNA-specific ribonuclease